MKKTVVIIEDQELIAMSIGDFFDSKGFDVIYIDNAEITNEEITNLLKDVKGEVVVISDYNDEVYGKTFSEVASHVVKDLESKGIKPFFVANSAGLENNNKLVSDLKMFLGDTFEADAYETNKRARNILNEILKKGENKEGKIMA